MAEQYTIGTNRIVYRSTSFEENLDIFVDVYCPDGLREPSITLIEMEQGLYYFVYDFSKIGVYTGIFYEGGTKRISQNFRIIKKDGGCRWIQTISWGQCNKWIGEL